MEALKSFCQSCCEVTLYTGAKARFCCHCGQPFAVFANKVTVAVSAPKVVESVTEQDLEDEELALSKIKTASYYRNRVKGQKAEVEDNSEEEDDGDDFQGGDPDFRGSGNQPNLLDVLSNGAKKNAGVKFSDIIKSSELPLSNEPTKPTRKSVAKSTSSKRGRKKS